MVATKERDPATGKLGSPTMCPSGIANLSGKSALIFDDICDGGYTFIQLAEYLQDNCNCALDLAVTHGIFSKGLGRLRENFDKIYTTDSMPKTFGTILIEHNKYEEKEGK